MCSSDLENILSFEKQYPGCEVIKLEQNYRSTENILNAANAVIRNNKQRKDKQLWSALGDGDKIKCCNFESEIAEARFVADTILDGVKEGKHYTDYALLYRSNSQSRSFENTLARSGIPYNSQTPQIHHLHNALPDNPSELMPLSHLPSRV